ncbi:hypothetical protein P8605_49640, partial [Streptomyces sp. T-3]|nr:hypothetical protein [Streptomyces sp. T-3]
MGIFDRFRHDKKSDDSGKEQVQEQAQPGQTAPEPQASSAPDTSAAATAEKYAGASEDAVDATKAAADRLAANARIAPEQPKAEA